MNKQEIQLTAGYMAELANLVNRLCLNPGRHDSGLLNKVEKQTGILLTQLKRLALTDAADFQLQRQFLMYLQELNDLGLSLEQQLDVMQPDSAVLIQQPLEAGLNLLTDTAIACCPKILPENWTAFPAYIRHWSKRTAVTRHSFESALAESACPARLKTCLSNWLAELKKAADKRALTFRTLHYAERILEDLGPFNDQSSTAQADFLRLQLIRCNFNQLDYLSYLQEWLRSELNRQPFPARAAWVRDRQALFCSSVSPVLRYDILWPDISVMLSCWFKEELAADNPLKQDAMPAKIFLDTSVAHLACFLRVFQESGISGLSGTELFRWIAAHCRTKRQSDISVKSLGKEFYTINQFTAARVRDQLLKMAAGITSHYFPVLAVAGIAYHVFSTN